MTLFCICIVIHLYSIKRFIGEDEYIRSLTENCLKVSKSYNILIPYRSQGGPLSEDALSTQVSKGIY